MTGYDKFIGSSSRKVTNVKALNLNYSSNSYINKEDYLCKMFWINKHTINYVTQSWFVDVRLGPHAHGQEDASSNPMVSRVMSPSCPWIRLVTLLAPGFGWSYFLSFTLLWIKAFPESMNVSTADGRAWYYSACLWTFRSSELISSPV